MKTVKPRIGTVLPGPLAKRAHIHARGTTFRPCVGTKAPGSTVYAPCERINSPQKGVGGEGEAPFQYPGTVSASGNFFFNTNPTFNEILHLEPNMRLSHQEKGGKTHGHRNIGLPAHNGHGISVEVIQ